MKKVPAPHPMAFFDQLNWLDGRPLLRTIEDYRARTFTEVLYTFDEDGRPHYSRSLIGRAKKNWKTSDLILAVLYRFLAWPSDKGNDCAILANDESQAGDDLKLAKKLIAANPILAREVDVQAKQIVRKDDKGTLLILPSKDVAGAHGKTFLVTAYDEIHGYKNYDLFEALAPDPSRLDQLEWITSYASLFNREGAPLHDLIKIGKAGDDPRMYFSWYAGDYTTDPNLQDAEPEARANPSMASWNNPGYLAQQRRRLPTHRYRRLHLNLQGAPDGAAFAADKVVEAIVTGRKRIPPEPGRRHSGFVDMSGGSSDFAVLGIAYHDDTSDRSVLACLVAQTGRPPFNPRDAVKKFAKVLKEYGLTRVTGDAYAGQTFRVDFEAEGITYVVAGTPKSDIYDALEPKLNAGEVELLDMPELQEQLLTLVIRGSKIDHQPGDHDDYANAAAGAIWLVKAKQPLVVSDAVLARAARPQSPRSMQSFFPGANR